MVWKASYIRTYLLAYSKDGKLIRWWQPREAQFTWSFLIFPWHLESRPWQRRPSLPYGLPLHVSLSCCCCRCSWKRWVLEWWPRKCWCRRHRRLRSPGTVSSRCTSGCLPSWWCNPVFPWCRGWGAGRCISFRRCTCLDDQGNSCIPMWGTICSRSSSFEALPDHGRIRILAPWECSHTAGPSTRTYTVRSWPFSSIHSPSSYCSSWWVE